MERRRSLIFFTSAIAGALWLAGSCWAQTIAPYRIETVAGSELRVGDGGPAVVAPLFLPSDVAADADGNLYIADTNHRRVRKVTPDGIITTVAGNGRTGSDGDGGPAVDATLMGPTAVTVDPDGNVYFTDGYRIRKVTPEGTVHAFAGTGEWDSNSPGDGGPAIEAKLGGLRDIETDAAGNVYIAEENRIRRVNPAGIIERVAGTGVRGIDGNGGPATLAAIDVSGLGVDAAGNLYIAEFYGDVRKVSAATGTIQAVAGQPGLCNPGGDGGPATEACLGFVQDVAVDALGNLYISANNKHVRKVSGVTGIIDAFAGTSGSGFSGDGGPATQARFAGAGKVTADAQRNVYITDEGNHRIRRVTPQGVIDTVAGRPREVDTPGPALSAQFLSPNDVAFDRQGNLYIADTENHRVRRMTLEGLVETVAGSGDARGFEGDGGPATEALLSRPTSVAVDSQGNIYINDSGNDRIRRVSPAGHIETFAGSGDCTGSAPKVAPATDFPLCDAGGVAVDNSGNVYVADHDLGIIRVDPNGTASVLAEVFRPTDVAVNDTGSLFVASLWSLSRIDPDGRVTVLPTGGLSTGTVALDSEGTVYCSTFTDQIIRVDPDGSVKTIAGTYGTSGFSGDGGIAVFARLDGPAGLAVGPDGAIYFADSNNSRIRKLIRLADNLPFIADDGVRNAASFASGQALAPDSWVALFGVQLTEAIVVAETTPLPTSLGGISVRIVDSTGAAHLAFLLFVAPLQINLLIPSGVALGPATVMVIRDGVESSVIPIEIAPVAPGLFTMNANGRGVAAALAVFAKGDGSQSWQYVFNEPCFAGFCEPVPIDLGPASDTVFLTLYGTGIRGRSSLAAVTAKIGGVDAPVEYAGPVAGLVGLDQVNLRVPRSLIGRGQVDIILMVDGKATNTVTVNIK